tara:strand:- start:30 stop:203 length:174 start_codon:yes stop_codon:yes gene_type:complete
MENYRQMTLRIPEDLAKFLDKKIARMKKLKKLKGKVSYQSVIEALVANWKAEDDQFE